MRIASIRQPDGSTHVALVTDRGVVDVTEAGGGDPLLGSVESVVQSGNAGLAACQSHAGGPAASLDEVTFAPPLRAPAQIVAIGRNYRDHAAEATIELPELPRLFCKWPSTVVGNGIAIQKPTRTDQLDWEVELAVVIGKPASRVSKEDALDHVFGYTILDDVSARDIQFSKPEQLTLGKNYRTFTPLGSWIVTADEVPDPTSVGLRSWVNNELMQDSSSKYLIFDIPTLISFISEVTDLSPGDIISTGTPSGVGCFREPPIFLRHGDTVHMELSLGEKTICSLTNPVIDAA